MYLGQIIYTHFRLGILNELQYRANFWIQLFQTILGLTTSIGGLLVVFRHSSTLGGWYPDELLALVGIYFLMRGAIYSVVQPSMELFMQDVRMGTLDYALIKPVDSQLLVSIRRVSIWNLFDGVVGAGLIVIALSRLGSQFGFLQASSFILTLSCGGVIVYSFWVILATFSFWFVKVENILVIFESMYQAGRWPVNIYPQFLQILLTFLVPVAFAVTVPAQALTNRLSMANTILAVGVSITLFTVARLFWRFGIQSYSGASA